MAAVVQSRQILYWTSVQFPEQLAVSLHPDNQMVFYYSSGSGVPEMLASYPVQPEVASQQNKSSPDSQLPRPVYTGRTSASDL